MCYRESKTELPDTPAKSNAFTGSQEVEMDTSKPKVDFAMLADYVAFVNKRRTLMADEHARKTYERRD